MPALAVLLLALPATAQRVVVPRLSARPAVVAPVLPVMTQSPLSFASAGLSAPSLAPTPLALAPLQAAVAVPVRIPAAADAPIPQAVAAPDTLLGKTAKAIAVTDAESPDWEAVFEEMYSGRYKGPKPWTDIPDSPLVAVGGMTIDKRAPGARELLKALALPNDTPVLGIFERAGERIVNGMALGTNGVRGHKDALPPERARRDHGGYTLGLAKDGSIRLIGSGHLPADMTPRLRRRLKRYYGLTPAGEGAWAKLRRGLWALWDALSS